MRGPRELADDIDAAAAEHRAAYPNGDYRAVNDRLGKLFYESMPILLAAGIGPHRGGNEGRARALRSLADRDTGDLT